MKHFELWKLSCRNVFAAPIRSFLTVLGFAIGVAAILAVLTLGDAGKEQVQSEMSRLGIDTVWVTGDNTAHPLQAGIGEKLAASTGSTAHELVYLPAQVVKKNGELQTVSVIGCNYEYARSIPVEKGRNISRAEWNERCGVILTGEKLADEMGWLLGDFVTIFQNTYQICGITGSVDGVSSLPADEGLIVPLDMVNPLTGGQLAEIQLTAGSLSVKTTKTLAQRTLDRLETGAQATALEVQMEAASEVVYTFVNVLRWVAFVCMLVGGIGVMNILLVNVRERKREIGIMKSIGTTPVQICILFLLEAFFYALSGGITGLMMGDLLICVAGRSISLPAAADFWDCIAVLFAAAAVGLVFGVLPALRASMLKCVDALRQE